MAARTASVSGLWNNTATWGGAAAPVDGDTFTINSGVVVEFNVDQSGFANGLGASTINGTLFFTRTAGTYYLKMNANLTVSGTGTLDASDGSSGAYPSNCYATIKFSSGFGIVATTSGATVTLRPKTPTHMWAKLTANAALSATVLSIDTDLTAAGDSFIWKNPYLVRVDDINQNVESEQYTISSLSSTQITLSSGLTNAKSTGAYVILTSTNIDIVGAGTAAGTGFTGVQTGSGVILGGVRDFNIGIASPATVLVISGCASGVSPTTAIGGTITVITGCTNALSSAVNTTVTLISGSTNGMSGGNGNVATTTSGCSTGINSGTNNSAGTITGCTSGMSGGSSEYRMANVTFNSNSRDILNLENATFFNCLFGSATEFANYNATTRGINSEVRSFDHDQVANSYKGWCRGGIVTSDTGTVYDASRARSYKHACETGPTVNFSAANNYVFKTVEVFVPAGASLYVRCYVQKDASMSYLPRLWVFSGDKEPLISGSPDSEQIMTNSTNTWEILETTVINTTTTDKLYKVRTLAKNASGNVYFDPIIRLSSYRPSLEMAGGMVA